MKKYVFIAIIAGFVTSCTNDSADGLLPQNKNIEQTDFSSLERDGDSIGIDTGGQGGSIPIKPPKP